MHSPGVQFTRTNLSQSTLTKIPKVLEDTKTKVPHIIIIFSLSWAVSAIQKVLLEFVTKDPHILYFFVGETDLR